MITKVDAQKLSKGESSKMVWLQRAFAVQTTLFILLILGVLYVSWSYTQRQSGMSKELADRQGKLDDLQKRIDQQKRELTSREYDTVLSLMRLKDYPSAEEQVSELLRDQKTDPFAWRAKALILIHGNRAQEAMDDFHAALGNPTDGKDLLTEALLDCAMKQSEKAQELKAKAVADHLPDSGDKEDFESVCHKSI